MPAFGAQLADRCAMECLQRGWAASGCPRDIIGKAAHPSQVVAVLKSFCLIPVPLNHSLCIKGMATSPPSWAVPHPSPSRRTTSCSRWAAGVANTRSALAWAMGLAPICQAAGTL